MSEFTLRQGNITAKLDGVFFEPEESFEQDGTRHVIEEYISAESETELQDGPGTLVHNGVEYAVEVIVVPLEEELAELAEEDEIPFLIEIEYAEGVRKLAEILKLL